MLNVEVVDGLTIAEILNRNTRHDSGVVRLSPTEAKMTSVPMDYEQCCGYLPQVFRELVSRLQSSRNKQQSKGVACCGKARLDRRRQGYSAAMLVEESRMLEVSIFQTLQNHIASIDFSLVLRA